MQRSLSLLAVGLIALSVVGHAQAGFLKRGDIVVADVEQNMIVRVDPATGERTLLSGTGRGDGPTLTGPTSIVQAPDGSLLVTDVVAARVLRIDPETGNRSTISQQELPIEYLFGDRTPIGAGPDFQPSLLQFFTGNVALRNDGGVLVLASNGLFHVDPISGDRTLLSGDSAGSGPLWSNPVHGMAQAANGDLYFASFNGGVLFRVDPFTGERTIVSDANTGVGPPFLHSSLAPIIAPDGSILVSTGGGGILYILRVDPLTGDREILSGSEGIAGMSAAWLSDDELVLAWAEPIDGTLRVFNLTTGDLTTLTGGGVGSGPDLTWPVSMIVWVPEPSSMTLVLIGLLGALPFAARKLVGRSKRATL